MNSYLIQTHCSNKILIKFSILSRHPKKLFTLIIQICLFILTKIRELFKLLTLPLKRFNFVFLSRARKYFKQLLLCFGESCVKWVL